MYNSYACFVIILPIHIQILYKKHCSSEPIRMSAHPDDKPHYFYTIRKMYHTPTSNVYQSTRTLCRLLKLVGIACFTIVPHISTTIVGGFDVGLFLLNMITATLLAIQSYLMPIADVEYPIHGLSLKYLACISHNRNFSQRARMAAPTTGRHSARSAFDGRTCTKAMSAFDTSETDACSSGSWLDWARTTPPWLY